MVIYFESLAGCSKVSHFSLPYRYVDFGMGLISNKINYLYPRNMAQLF